MNGKFGQRIAPSLERFASTVMSYLLSCRIRDVCNHAPRRRRVVRIVADRAVMDAVAGCGAGGHAPAPGPQLPVSGTVHFLASFRSVWTIAPEPLASASKLRLGSWVQSRRP
jgi:hypothetical protein